MTIQQAMQQLEDAGQFRRAAGGDQRAASLFVRAAAQLANPNGADRTSWGWLSKSPGESQVDGYSEDSLVLGDSPSNLQNVYDFVAGTGRVGASIIYTPSAVQRRPSNVWVAPRPLTAAEQAYLGGGTIDPPPPPVKPPYAGDQVWWETLGNPLEQDMALAGQTLNAGSSVWFARVGYDHYVQGMTIAEATAKHRRGWRTILGLPPL